MSVRMRHTKAHSANRRSHHALKKAVLSKCAECGASRKPHQACANCGTYKGRQAVSQKDPVKKAAKKSAK